MSARDQRLELAGLALQGLLAGRDRQRTPGESAEEALAHADALLKWAGHPGESDLVGAAEAAALALEDVLAGRPPAAAVPALIARLHAAVGQARTAGQA